MDSSSIDITNNNNIFILDGGREESYDIRNFKFGITRKKTSSGYEYYYIKSGQKVSKADLDRIKQFKIPPAWTDVWVSNDPETSIQVVGTDAKGRKQYKYHEEHIAEAEKSKFLRLIEFIKAMPKLDKIMRDHKKLPPYSKFKVITTMLSLVKKLHIRAGKEQYARENKSYGISSLKKIHVKLEGSDIIKLKFKGKSRKKLSYSLKDPEIKEHIALLLKLDGDKLFQYIDENDNIRMMTYVEINHYIQQYMGDEFTVKDFRTYAANLYFIKSLLTETSKRSPKNEKVIKKNILNALKITAHYLRHTKAISKKSYVMNFCIELYMEDPKYFMERRSDNPTDVLLDVLTLYKKNVLSIK